MKRKPDIAIGWAIHGKDCACSGRTTANSICCDFVRLLLRLFI